MSEKQRGGSRPATRADDKRHNNRGSTSPRNPGGGRKRKARTVFVNGEPLAGLWTVEISDDGNVYLVRVKEE